jgi:hypothetical protein
VDLTPEVERVERLVRAGKVGPRWMVDAVRATWPVPTFGVDRVGGEVRPTPTG